MQQRNRIQAGDRGDLSRRPETRGDSTCEEDPRATNILVPTGALGYALSVEGSERRNRWLFGPAPDLLLGCGLFYALVFVAYAVAGPQILSVQPSYLLPLLVILFSMPHYGGTLVRVYEQRGERHRYAVFAVWLTLALFALFLWGAHDVLVASVLLTVYITWSPWHYTGQNYGLALMFLRRRNVDVTPALKRWIYASFLLSYLFTFLVMHVSAVSGYSAIEYESTSVTFLPLGIPPVLGQLLVPAAGTAYLLATAIAAVRLVRCGGLREVAPAGALALTQALWFVLPFGVRYTGWQTGVSPLDHQDTIRDYILLIFVGHGIQYLWVTSYYARASERWSGFGNYYAKVLASGVSVWTLPYLLYAPLGLGRLSFDAGMALLVAAIVNIHHFMLDGAIWKLRNVRIAGVLIRSQHDAPPDAVGDSRSWGRRLVWTTAAAGLALAFFEYWESRIAYPRALGRGNVAEASAILDRLGWIGQDRSKRRTSLGHRHERRGEFEAAVAEYSRSLELLPAAETWVRLGQAETRRGNLAAAREAYASAQAAGFAQPARLQQEMGTLARRSGDCRAAVEHFRMAVQRAPKSRRSANDLAWTLATCSDAEQRRPEESVRIAEMVVGSSEVRNSSLLDTLAAAYAAAGRYEEAVRTATEASQLADADGNVALRDEIAGKLSLYRAGRPFVEAPTTDGS